MLHYHRCDDCLTTFSSTERKVDECDCNGSVHYMGQVHGSNYVEVKDKAPCDGRCTHAAGPVCDCECGGVNHGTGKVVQVTTVLGKIKVTGLSPEDVERAHTFRKLRDYAFKVFTEKWAEANATISSGGRVDYSIYSAIRRDKLELDKIVQMKVYNKRTKALVDFISKNVKR